eukprot:CAMPEP_0119051824 /NCGR_PEP_ID=MMETSP1177-20130426/73313_1 /TAXON_ID=2985 /ORGANISM="Ochromonas sp, Strain CCMP1899" /LENGTH=1177 /DNA_ID=CAMNT_0007031159 /DNA_START=280 /DNA_END=3813 /DNA_ORIENTATION=-
MNEDKLQNVEDFASIHTREGEVLDLNNQSYYDDGTEYDSDTIPFEEEVDKLEGDKQIQLYDQILDTFKIPSEENRKDNQIAEQFSEITFLKLKVKLLVNASNKKYKELEIKYEASEDTVKTLVKINQSYKEEEGEERERYSVWSPPGLNGTPQSPMLSSPQLSEITNSLANLKWGFRKREAELLSQIELYKASTIKLNNSQQRLRGCLRDVCEKLCDGLVVAELIVEKSEEAIENDSKGYSENNSPSKLQLQLEDLKQINDSLKLQNTELMALCANPSHPDMDMRNPDMDMRNADMDMRIPDTDDVVEVHLKQQQDILKQQQDEYIAEQIEAQQQHEEFQYEKELMKQVQDELELQQNELKQQQVEVKQRQVELKQQNEELQFEQEISKQQQTELNQQQSEQKQEQIELKHVENELKSQILEFNQQQNIKPDFINENNSNEMLNEEIKSLQNELEFIKNKYETNIFNLSEYNDILKSQVAALSESVNATEERRNQGGRVAEERLSPNPRIEDPRSPNPRIEDPNPGERRSFNPRIEDHLPDNYRSPLSKNAMPAEESLDFKRAFKGGVDPKHERGSYDAFLLASNASPSMYHTMKNDEIENVYGEDGYYGEGDYEEGGFNLLDDRNDNDDIKEDNVRNKGNDDDNDTCDNEVDVNNTNYDKYDYTNKPNYDEYDDDTIDDDTNDGIHLDITDYLNTGINQSTEQPIKAHGSPNPNPDHDNVHNDDYIYVHNNEDISMDYSEFDYPDLGNKHDNEKKDDFQIIQSRLRTIDSIMVGLDEDDNDVEDETNEVEKKAENENEEENEVDAMKIEDLMHYGGFLETRVGYDMKDLKDLDFQLHTHLSSLEDIGLADNSVIKGHNMPHSPSIKAPYINTLKARPRNPVNSSPSSPLRSPLLRSPSRSGTPRVGTGTGLIKSLDSELRSHLNAIENIHAKKGASARSNDLSIETFYDDKESFEYRKSDINAQNGRMDRNYLSIQKDLEGKLERLQKDLGLKNAQPDHHQHGKKIPQDKQHDKLYQQQFNQEENALHHIQAQRALLQADVQHLNDLKAVMEKDLKVAQFVPHTPIQDHDFGGSIRSVSTRSVRSNSGGELYNTYSNESNHYKEDKERDKIHINQLVESLKVARMAVDISNDDMDRTHLKMTELTGKINYLTGKNKHLQSFYDQYHDKNNNKIRSN